MFKNHLLELILVIFSIIVLLPKFKLEFKYQYKNMKKLYNKIKKFLAEQLNWIKQYPSKVWSVGSNPTSVTNLIRMSKDNNNMNTKLQTLEKLLQNHDWFYQYSDDFSVYERGQFAWDTITTVMKVLEEAGFGKEVDALYDKYLPEPLKF